MLAFATLTAVMVTEVVLEIVGGAVYRPVEEMAPVVAVQVTAVFHPPETAAVNCCIWEGPSVRVDGLTETVTAGTRWMAAVAVLPSAALVATRLSVDGT
jgi:hypothetical protein